MLTQSLLNERYKQLCAELGDVTYRLFILQKRAEELRGEIMQMDALTPALLKQEKTLTAQIEGIVKHSYEKEKETKVERLDDV